MGSVFDPLAEDDGTPPWWDDEVDKLSKAVEAPKSEMASREGFFEEHGDDPILDDVFGTDWRKCPHCDSLNTHAECHGDWGCEPRYCLDCKASEMPSHRPVDPTRHDDCEVATGWYIGEEAKSIYVMTEDAKMRVHAQRLAWKKEQERAAQQKAEDDEKARLEQLRIEAERKAAEELAAARQAYIDEAAF